MSVMREGWTYRSIEELCDIICGQDYKSVQDNNGTYPIYGTGGIMGYASQYRCPANCVIIGRKGNINNPLYVEQPFWNVDTAFGVFPKKLYPKFFYYFCRNYDFTKHDVSVTIPSLRRTDIMKIKVPVPPLAEQERIVAELDLLSGIIDKQKAQLKELDTLAQSIFYDMFGNPVENDKGWESSELNDVCDVRDGTHDSPEYHEEGYPLITSKNVIDGKISFDNVSYISKEDYDNISKRSRVDDGDIIMPMIGTIGKPTIVKKDRDFAIKNVALIKFIPNTRVLNVFIRAIMSTPSFELYMKSKNKGGTQKFIALGDIRKLKVPIPSLELQVLFAEKLSKVEQQKESINQSIAESQKLFDYTMDKYFG